MGNDYSMFSIYTVYIKWIKQTSNTEWIKTTPNQMMDYKMALQLYNSSKPSTIDARLWTGFLLTLTKSWDQDRQNSQLIWLTERKWEWMPCQIDFGT